MSEASANFVQICPSNQVPYTYSGKKGNYKVKCKLACQEPDTKPGFCNKCNLGLGLYKYRCQNVCQTQSSEGFCSSCLVSQHLDRGLCWDGSIRDDKGYWVGCQQETYIYHHPITKEKACTDGCLEHNKDLKSCMQCREGFYKKLDNLCYACEEGCLECNDKGECVGKRCGEGYWIQQLFNANYCKKCDSSCLTCGGPGSQSCKYCPRKTAMTKYGSCMKCPNGCAECNGIDRSECLSCEDGYYFSDTIIEKNTEEDEKRIAQWNKNLKNKLGEENTDIEDIPKATKVAIMDSSDGIYSNRYITISSVLQRRAHLAQMLNFYENSKKGSCLKCHKACKKCTSDKDYDCFMCSDGYYFQMSYENTKYEVHLGKCIVCDKSCETCIGPGHDQCQTCKLNYFIQTLTYDDGARTGRCIETKCSGLTCGQAAAKQEKLEKLEKEEKARKVQASKKAMEAVEKKEQVNPLYAPIKPQKSTSIDSAIVIQKYNPGSGVGGSIPQVDGLAKDTVQFGIVLTGGNTGSIPTVVLDDSSDGLTTEQIIADIASKGGSIGNISGQKQMNEKQAMDTKQDQIKALEQRQKNMIAMYQGSSYDNSPENFNF